MITPTGTFAPPVVTGGWRDSRGVPVPLTLSTAAALTLIGPDEPGCGAAQRPGDAFAATWFSDCSSHIHGRRCCSRKKELPGPQSHAPSLGTVATVLTQFPPHRSARFLCAENPQRPVHARFRRRRRIVADGCADTATTVSFRNIGSICSCFSPDLLLALAGHIHTRFFLNFSISSI